MEKTSILRSVQNITAVFANFSCKISLSHSLTPYIQHETKFHESNANSDMIDESIESKKRLTMPYLGSW